MGYIVKINHDDTTLRKVDNFNIHLNKFRKDPLGLVMDNVLYLYTYSSPSLDLSKFFANLRNVTFIEIFSEDNELIYSSDIWHYTRDAWDNGKVVREMLINTKEDNQGNEN